MSDIAAEIWRRAVPGEYPATAEDRARVDDVLLGALDEIDDGLVRSHAICLIKQVRAAAMRGEKLPERWLTEQGRESDI